MSRKALTEENYQRIKSHILNPEDSPLPGYLQDQLDRILSMAKVLDKNPVIKHAVSLHRSKYPEISDATAYKDARMARRLFNSLHEFDFDFWQTWLINDIVENIQRCRNNPSPQNNRVIAMEHANLIRAIGEKPQDLPDPRRNEKHQFFLLMQLNNQQVKIDLNSLEKLSPQILAELNRELSAGTEIDSDQAKKIMES